MDSYILGPCKTLIVQATSVPLLAADVKPTSGPYEGMQAEVATIQAVGALYVEAGGGAATTASFPMAAGDVLKFEGYQNIKNLRFISTDTTLVWIPGYR